MYVIPFYGITQNGITGNPVWIIKPTYNIGFILEHRSTIGHLVKGYPVTYEIDVVKPALGNKLWQIENNLPDIGISLQFIDFKNPQQLGYASVIAPFIEIPLNAKQKTLRLIMRICWGATYINKPFNIETNQKNTAIGSHINQFVQFKWFWHIALNKYTRFEPGITFSHASNGKAKNPNLGLNILSLNAGLTIKIPTKKTIPNYTLDSNTKAKTKNELLLYTAMGINQREIGTPQLKTFVATMQYQRNVRNTHKFSAGVDVFYDENYQTDFENKLLIKANGLEQIRMAAKFGYSYNIGRVSIPIEMGYYFYSKAKPDGPVVSRLAIRYYSKCGLIAHLGLRTHFAVAYNFEYGLGYRLYLGHKK
jgi:hypothetical protein